MVGRASGTLARVEGPDCLHSISMPVDRDLFRRSSGSFPTGVTIITTGDADGAPKGLHESSVAYPEYAVDRRIEARDHWIFMPAPAVG